MSSACEWSGVHLLRPFKSRWLALAIGFAVGIGGTSTARVHAQNASALEDTSDDSDAEARARYEAGSLAFNAGRFEEALSDFQRAYDLSQRPGLLYNLGATEVRLGHDREAVRLFQQFVAAAPENPRRPQVEAQLRILEARIAREDELIRAAEQARQQDEPIEIVPVTTTPVVERSDDLPVVLGICAAVLVVAAGVTVSIALTQGPTEHTGNTQPGVIRFP